MLCSGPEVTHGHPPLNADLLLRSHLHLLSDNLFYESHRHCSHNLLCLQVPYQVNVITPVPHHYSFPGQLI